ncbi:MAG: type II secretion system minor pseudopilin GspH [Chromatiales bacterium]|nr:MAG: type II secretion system minor pseudopilin GspH [Chromatiales bacterium]
MAPEHSRGFSLLELLVVVVIIGILATMFTLSVGITSGDRELEREADRLQALLQLASEDAVLQGRELGLRFYPDAYEFSVLDPVENRWQIALQDPLLRERKFENDVELLVTIEGREIDLDASQEEREERRAAAADKAAESEDGEAQPDEDADEDAGYRPQVFLFSSGDLSPPFTVELRRRFGDLRLTLEVAENGEIELTREQF